MSRWASRRVEPSPTRKASGWYPRVTTFVMPDEISRYLSIYRGQRPRPSWIKMWLASCSCLSLARLTLHQLCGPSSHLSGKDGPPSNRVWAMVKHGFHGREVGGCLFDVFVVNAALATDHNREEEKFSSAWTWCSLEKSVSFYTNLEQVN